MLFYPYGARLISHDFPLWMNVITTLGQRLGMTLAGASNLWFALSWVLAGYCVYGLVREVWRSEDGGSEAPAYVAGIYAMTHSYALARAMQNWGQFNFYAIALFLWSLIRARRVGSFRAFAVSGVVLAWTAACHYYFFIYAATLWVVVAVCDLSPVRVSCARRTPPLHIHRILFFIASLAGAAAIFIRMHPGNLTIGSHVIGLHGPENAIFVLWAALVVWGILHFRFTTTRRIARGGWMNYSLLIGTAVVLLVPLFWETAQLIREGGYPRQSILWKTHLPGANLLALFSPNAIQAVWGTKVSEWFASRGMNPQEQAASIGWVCLAIILLTKLWKDSVAKKWGALAVGSTLLAMGAHLHIAQYNTWLPMPFFFVRLLPVLGNVRVPERWMALGAVAWAVVLAYALIRLSRDRATSLKVLGMIVGGALLIENWPGLPFRPLPPTSPVLERLRNLPEGAVLALPFYAGDSSIGTGNAVEGDGIFPWDHLWAQTQHLHPIVGGYMGRISRRVIEGYQADPFLKSVIDLEERAIPDKEAEPAFGTYGLANLKFKYVLAYSHAMEPSALRYALQSLPLELLENSEGLQLYRVNQ